MIQKKSLFCALIILLLGPAVLGQEFWQKKPYSKWSKAETDKMLKDSPWSHSTTLSAVAMTGVGRATGPIGGTAASGMPTIVPGTTGADTGRQSTPQITYTAQTRSAKPVREAVVRQLQIQTNYESLPEQQRTALEMRTTEYLNAPQDAIVIYVRYESNVPNYLVEVRRYWVQQTVELLKTSVFLSIGGERLSPVAYVASDEAFQFTFVRPVEIPARGSAVLEFMHPTIGTIATERMVFDFKLDKMAYGGVPSI